MKNKTCGRDASCDLVVEHATVSRLHACISLADDGYVWVHDEDSSNGIFLHRSESWTRISKAMLCIGDRIRFGELELPLEKLTALFGADTKVRLGDRRFPLQAKHIDADLRAGLGNAGEQVQKPRRNPATGKIEEKSRA